jgi:photosystem II stability/assembly factor-like uncharacterized protein
MRKICTLIILVISSFNSNAQWAITTGPVEANVTSLAGNDTVLMAGCSSASTNVGGHRTLDNGNNWSVTGVNLVSKFSALAIDSSNGYVYAGGQNALYISTDKGASFVNINNGLSPYTVHDIIIDGTNLYASAQGIYYSSNGGLNWSLISPVISSNKMDKSGSTILVSTLTSGIYLSNNNGSSWTNITTGLPTTINDVKIIGNTYYAATANGIYISTNNGASWALAFLTSGSECFHQIGSTLFVGRSGGGVYYSTNGGSMWTSANTGLTNLTVYSLTSNSTYLFAGTSGYVFRRPLTDFGITTGISEQNTSVVNINIAPNPTTGIFNITQSEAKEIEIVVYNTIGEKVFNSATSDKTSTLNLSQLSKGLYIIKLTDEAKNTIAKKVVLE